MSFLSNDLLPSLTPPIPGMSQPPQGYNNAGDGNFPPTGGGGVPGGTRLWGTNIDIEAYKERFRSFIDLYRRTKGFEDALRKAITGNEGGRTLEIDFTVLRDLDFELYRQTVTSPSECLAMMSAVVEDLFSGIFSNTLGRAGEGADEEEERDDDNLRVAPRNLPSSSAIRELGPSNIETLIAVRGLVVRTSKVIPEVSVAHFECWACKHTEKSVVERGRIFEPTRCSHCSRQYSFQLVHNLSLFEDKQLIRIQEAPENLADGETPVTISAVVYGDLVDSVVPGDRVVLTGIYRAAPLKLNANTRIVKSVFKTHIDAAHLEKASHTTNFVSGESDFDFSDLEKIDELRAIGNRKDVYNLLLQSLAPTIWGLEDVKLGILCQLFGGTRKVFEHGSFLAEVNIILCGDPGVAKSQLLSQVHRISPRGVYTSGKGSSSVGLTAYVVKDSDTGEFVLEPGALVLSDRGICCIDEFDKMGEDTRSVLHEVMEQQTLSIAKAGIIAQLNARTSILAAANPKESQWNPTLNIIENLQIEPTLISRFDLIYLLLDKKDEGLDRMLAKHVLDMYTDDGAQKPAPSSSSASSPTSTGPRGGDRATTTTATTVTTSVAQRQMDADIAEGSILDRKVFSQYIAYAKECVHPKLTEEAHEALAKAYVSLRKAGGASGVGGATKTVTATLRQLESMIRLSESHAKIRLSNEVTVADVREAQRLISTALKEAATDPRTGLISMDIFAAADLSKNSVESSILRLEQIIRSKYLAHNKKSCSINELRNALQEEVSHSHSGGSRTVSSQQFLDALAAMADGDFVKSYTSTVVHFASSGN